MEEVLMSELEKIMTVGGVIVLLVLLMLWNARR